MGVYTLSSLGLIPLGKIIYCARLVISALSIQVDVTRESDLRHRTVDLVLTVFFEYD
ncbi:hypothetical protein RSAG8_03575, partial [Rhizoctonia solani AG-8 WAC10335]